MRWKLIAFATATATIVLGGAVYAQNQTTPDLDPGSQTRYQNQQFNFSLNYPAGMTVSEDHEGSGETISFMDATSSKQFLIEVIPYSTINLANSVQTSDSSTSASDQGDTLSDVDVAVDDTVQIIFTKNGVLYEVVGLKDDEPWLLSLLQTWRFN